MPGGVERKKQAVDGRRVNGYASATAVFALEGPMFNNTHAGEEREMQTRTENDVTLDKIIVNLQGDHKEIQRCISEALIAITRIQHGEADDSISSRIMYLSKIVLDNYSHEKAFFFPAAIRFLDGTHRKLSEDGHDYCAGEDYDMMVMIETYIRAGLSTVAKASEIDFSKIDYSCKEDLIALRLVLNALEERISFVDKNVFPVLLNRL